MADRTVLLVDPSEEDRKAHAKALSRLGGTVRCVEAGTKADALARLDASCDLVILEPLLPDGSGLALLRARRSGKAPPVLVVTHLERDIDRFWALRLGAHAFLHKPVDPELLADRARKALSGAPPLRPRGL